MSGADQARGFFKALGNHAMVWKKIWWKREEGKVKFILKEDIWTEVYILDMLVEVVLEQLQHLHSICLSHNCVYIPTYVLASVSQPQKLQGLSSLPDYWGP